MMTPAAKTTQAWKDVAWLTVLGTAGILALSVGLNYALMFFDALTPFGRSMITAILLPVVLGVPLFLFIGLQQIKLHHYRRELDKSATFDSVTGCLNGGAFTSLVERRTSRPLASGPRSGAFLVIHPQHLRSINLRFGLGWGNEALRLIASTIQSSVRKEDMVGRVGASMFGVFLPGATEQNAMEVGNRIRARVEQVYFAPKGDEDVLTISIGGVVFESELGFEDMLRSAQEHLTGSDPTAGLQLSHVNQDRLYSAE